MALGTVTKVDAFVWGNRRVRIYDIQLSTGANWATAGESLLPSQVGLKKIIAAQPIGAALSSTPTTFQVTYNHTTNKLVAFGTHATPGAAVADIAVTANTDLSGFTVRMMFVGY